MKVATDVPFAALASIGCAVVTGEGAVSNAARVESGSSVAVIGAGGVGLNVVQGAVLAGCVRIVVVDRQVDALALASTLGATDVVQSGDRTAAAIRRLTGGGGADYVFDTVGTPDTFNEAFEATRKGGTVVLTGLSHRDNCGQLPLYRLVTQEKRLIGSLYGSGDPAQAIRRLVVLYQEGHLQLDVLATRQYKLTAVNDAVRDLAAGRSGRGILTSD